MAFYFRIRIRKILPDPDLRKRSGSGSATLLNLQIGGYRIFIMRHDQLISESVELYNRLSLHHLERVCYMINMFFL